MKLRVNPLAKNPNDRMSWRDAAIVALILTLANFFTSFWMQWTVSGIRADPLQWIYGGVGFFCASFFTNFIGLTGLSRLVRRLSKQGRAHPSV